MEDAKDAVDNNEEEGEAAFVGYSVESEHAYPRVVATQVIGNGPPEAKLLQLEILENHLVTQYSDVCLVVGPGGNEGWGHMVTVLPRCHDPRCVRLNIMVDNTRYQVKVVTYNSEVVRTVEVVPDNFSHMAALVEDITRSRYITCPGIKLPDEMMDTTLDRDDLLHLLIERYNNKICYRSRSCSYVLDTKDGDTKDSPNYCQQCWSLKQSLLEKYLLSLKKSKPTNPFRSTIKEEVEVEPDITHDFMDGTLYNDEDVLENKKIEFGENIGNMTITRRDHDKGDNATLAEGGKLKLEQERVQNKSTKRKRDSRDFICTYDECHKTFDKIYELKVHLQQHAGKDAIICKNFKCNEVFFSKEELEEHLLIHDQNKSFECQVCSKLFSNKAELSSHAATHTGNMISYNFTQKHYVFMIVKLVVLVLDFDLVYLVSLIQYFKQISL